MTNPLGSNAQIVVTTLENLSPKITDNITNNNALLMKIKEKGNVKKLSGGSKIREKISYASNGNVQFQGAWDTLSTTPQDVLSYADFEEKILTGTVSLNDVDITQNSGKERLIDLVSEQVKVLMASMSNQIGSSIYSDGTTSNEFGGLQLLIADDPTTGTVGGIDRSSYSFWRNKIYDFSVESVTASATTIQGAMNTLHRRCLVQGTESPDLVVAGDTYFSYFETSLQTIQRVTNEKLGALGYLTYKFKNLDVIYDPNCNASRMYFINTDHIFLKYWGENLVKTLAPRTPLNQLATVYPVVTIANLSIDNARVHGVMHA